MKINPSQFYSDLTVHEDFSCIGSAERFCDVPMDWHIVVADIVDSTGAIKRGLYREVNTIGTVVIVAILNLAENYDLPYIFGGDGATLCIPPELVEPAEKALLESTILAKDKFGFELKTGVVPVAEVRNAGHDLRIARCRMSPHLVNAMFIGDGLEYAEHLVKSNLQQKRGSEIEKSVDKDLDISGFECRWDRIPSRHGETIALIVKATGKNIAEKTQTYTDIVAKITTIYGRDEDCHPLHLSGLKLSLSKQKLSAEAAVKTYRKNSFQQYLFLFKLLGANLLGNILLGRFSKWFGDNWANYKREIIENCDFKKFDGTLRMVISGSAENRKLLSRYLDALEAEKKIIYGLHSSDSAQLTCLVFSRKHEHIHFVDGADGGYAMASVTLKEKMRRLVN